MSLKFPYASTNPIFLYVVLSTITLSACTDSDNNDDNGDNDVIGINTIGDQVITTIADPVESTIADPMEPVIEAAPVEPSMDDPENDDRPGLAITGLNGIPATQVTSPWLVNMNIFRNATAGNQAGNVFVELLRYDDTQQVATAIDFYTPELDTCFVRDLSESTVNTSGNNDSEEDDNNLYVSGGSSLTINSGNGPWLTIPVSDFNAGLYDTDFAATQGTPGPLPADATLSIPGMEFPNVAAYSVSEPTLVPVRIAPAFEPLTATDIAAPFTWETGPDVAGGYARLAGQSYDEDGNFVGFPFSCNIVDDGEFNMPQEVIDAFAASDLSTTVRFERATRRVDFVEGIVFHVRSVVTE